MINTGNVPCEVCLNGPYEQLLPERTPREVEEDVCVHQRLCTLCIDELLAFFPIRPSHFARRELTGRLQSRIRRRQCDTV